MTSVILCTDSFNSHHSICSSEKAPVTPDYYSQISLLPFTSFALSRRPIIARWLITARPRPTTTMRPSRTTTIRCKSQHRIRLHSKHHRNMDRTSRSRQERRHSRIATDSKTMAKNRTLTRNSRLQSQSGTIGGPESWYVQLVKAAKTSVDVGSSLLSFWGMRPPLESPFKAMRRRSRSTVVESMAAKTTLDYRPTRSFYSPSSSRLQRCSAMRTCGWPGSSRNSSSGSPASSTSYSAS